MQQSKNAILEAGAKFLSSDDVLARLPKQIQEDIRSGKKEFAYAEFYMRKLLSGQSGIVQVIKETDDKTAGVTNMDKGKLPEDVYMAVVGVGIAYAYSATLTNVRAVRYSNSEYLNTITTQFINSDFRLKNGDRTIIEARTKKFLANAYSEYGGEANEENAVILPQPKLIDPKKIVNAEFEFPDTGLTAPTNNHFVEIVMYGVKVVDRVNM